MTPQGGGSDTRIMAIPVIQPITTDVRTAAIRVIGLHARRRDDPHFQTDVLAALGLDQEPS